MTQRLGGTERRATKRHYKNPNEQIGLTQCDTTSQRGDAIRALTTRRATQRQFETKLDVAAWRHNTS